MVDLYGLQFFFIVHSTFLCFQHCFIFNHELLFKAIIERIKSNFISKSTIQYFFFQLYYSMFENDDLRSVNRKQNNLNISSEIRLLFLSTKSSSHRKQNISGWLSEISDVENKLLSVHCVMQIYPLPRLLQRPPYVLWNFS